MGTLITRLKSSQGLLARIASVCFLACAGAYVIAPASLGTMPLSADHTVHLARAHAFSAVLASGSLRDWSNMWFLGFPLGDLYPILGDLFIVAIHGLLGQLLSWSQSYALAFAGIFILQGLAAFRLCTLLPLTPGYRYAAGVIAGLATYVDPGAYREGGWRYAVEYGVWPQSLAVALAWLAIADLYRALSDTKDSSSDTRSLARAALLFGSSILAHPIAVPMILIALVVFLSYFACAAKTRRTRAAIELLAAGALSIGVAAAWLLPMLANKASAANYGWLHLAIEQMIEMLKLGQWTQEFGATWGYASTIAILASLFTKSTWPRLCAALAIVFWCMASSSFFWDFRLDRLAGSFQNLQYQRFLTCAKPALYALSAFGLLLLPAACENRFRGRVHPKLASLLQLAALAASLGVASWQLRQHANVIFESGLQTTRLRAAPNEAPDLSLDQDYRDLVAWAQTQRDAQGVPARFHFLASRNSHWFMDFTALAPTHALYKSGFTPGDNFLHKPESHNHTVLARAGVDFNVIRKEREQAIPGEVIRFGSLHVTKVASLPDDSVLFFHQGQLQPQRSAMTASDAHDRWIVDVPAQLSFPAIVQLPVAHYGRWKVSRDNALLETFASPITQIDELSLQPPTKPRTRPLGKALGPDGSEPTLLSFIAQTPGRYEIYYQQRSTRDLIALLFSLTSIVGCLALLLRRKAVVLESNRLALIDRPTRWFIIVTAAASIALFSIIQLRAAQREQAYLRAHALVVPKPSKYAAKIFPLKTDMLLRPAVVARPSAGKPQQVLFYGLTLPDELRGWYGIEDDASQRRQFAGRHQLVFAAKPSDSNADYIEFARLPIAHTPNSQLFRIVSPACRDDGCDLQITFESTAKHGPEIGFDIALDPEVEPRP